MERKKSRVFRSNNKVKNELLLLKMEEFNIPSVAELSRQSGVGDSLLLGLINKELSPQDRKLRWRPCVLAIAKFFACTPHELFDADQICIASDRGKKRAIRCFNASWEEISFALRELTPEECGVLSLRFGLGERVKKTLMETKHVFKISVTRISDVEKKAIRKMKYLISKNKKKRIT